MKTSYAKILQYSVMATISLALFTAGGPVFARQHTQPAQHSGFLQTIEAQLLSRTERAKADDMIPQSTTTPDTSSVSSATNDAASTSDTTSTSTATTSTATSSVPAVANTSSSDSGKTPIVPAKKQPVAKVPPAFQNDSSGTSDVYASTLFNTAESQNLLALALIMSMFGFVLVGDKLIKRTFMGIAGLFSKVGQPQTSRSGA